MLYFFLRLLAILLFKFFFRFEVTGREYLPKKGGFLLVSNHASYLDPVALGIASSRPLYFFARWDLFKNPFFGELLRALHAFPVRIGKMDKRAIQESLEKLKEGRILVLFPEGTRAKDGSLRDGHVGAGFLAVRSGVPVVPAYLRGTFEAFPRGAKWIRFRKIFVHFGKPITFSGGIPPLLEGHHVFYQKVSDTLMGAIQELRDLTE